MSEQGVGQWPDFLKGANFHIGGFDLSGLEITVSQASGGVGGSTVNMASGGVRYQRTSMDEFAPLNAGFPMVFTVGFVPVINQITAHRIQSWPALASLGDMEASIAFTQADAWATVGDLRTQWTLSHKTSAGLLGPIDPVRAVITDRKGVETTVLTVVNSGPPAAGEVLVDNVADSDTIETNVAGPGSVANAGSVFQFTYYPTFAVSRVEVAFSNLEKNRLEAQVVVTCMPIAKDWSADDPS